jgi:hypothetical protein
MALFGGNKEQTAKEQAPEEQVTQEQAAVNEEEDMSDEEYNSFMTGQGTEGLVGDAVSTAYLSMVQPGSTASMEVEPGQWMNSATREGLGKTVEVIPLAFKTIWVERDKDPPFMTVGRYEPKSIAVTTTRPKPGQRGFPVMTNPETGNKVQELFIYALTLLDRPEVGVLYFSPTSSSMRTCKIWNRLIRSQSMPDGTPASIFAYTWVLYLDMVKNPQQPANFMAQFAQVTRGHLIPKQYFFKNVRPSLLAAQDVALLAAPEKSGDVEE